MSGYFNQPSFDSIIYRKPLSWTGSFSGSGEHHFRDEVPMSEGLETYTVDSSGKFTLQNVLESHPLPVGHLIQSFSYSDTLGSALDKGDGYFDSEGTLGDLIMVFERDGTYEMRLRPSPSAMRVHGYIHVDKSGGAATLTWLIEIANTHTQGTFTDFLFYAPRGRPITGKGKPGDPRYSGTITDDFAKMEHPFELQRGQASGTATYTWELQTFFLPYVIMISEKRSWPEGAAFLRRWFTEPARRQNSDTLPIDDTTITMDWLLSGQFKRANEAYDKMFRDHLYRTPAALEVLWKHVFEAFKGVPSKATESRINLSDLSLPPKKLHDLHITHIEVSDKLIGPIPGPPVLDALTSALHNFSFYVIPIGTATRNPDPRIGFEVILDGIAVHVWDVFEFDEDQELGMWQVPDKMSYNPFGDGVKVTNRDFRDYRDATERGGDFEIFTKPKVTKFVPPETFSFRLPPPP